MSDRIIELRSIPDFTTGFDAQHLVISPNDDQLKCSVTFDIP